MNPRFLLPLGLALVSHALAVPYDAVLAKTKPAAFWSFSESTALQNGATLGEGPRPPEFPAFQPQNQAILLQHDGASLRLPNREDGSLNFKKGESITLEAWVQCDRLSNGQNAYVIGKGRTGRAGFPSHNQNWGLRLREVDGTARVSFVFRDERDASSDRQEFWHRWTADTGFLPGPGWHHIAVSYTFGKPDSLRAYLEAESVSGDWDMGGKTELGPWSDQDEIWIGTSMGGAAGSSFKGALDEIAIHRSALTAADIRGRFEHITPAPKISLEQLPAGAVRVELFEHSVSESDRFAGDWTPSDSESSKNSVGWDASWGNLPAIRTDSWIEPAFALASIVPKFSPRGVVRDRSIPYLVRLSGLVTLPVGDHQLLVRALRGGRVAMDGQIIATSAFFPKAQGDLRASDAELVPDQLELQLVKEVALLPPGHSEVLTTIHGDGKAHLITFETFVGGKNKRPELGSPVLALSSNGAPFRLLTCNDQTLGFSDEAWKTYSYEQGERVAQLASARRNHSEESEYWNRRHQLAREHLAKLPPIPVPQIANPKSKIQTPVDSFIEAKLAESSLQPSPLVDDSAFLRRLSLDTIGLLPTAQELATFLADPSANKRALAIDRLLEDSRWADQWMPYWQDVLAENPAILKATLNNTGPFRFFLHDALRDNLAMDRFVTNLLAMEGSPVNGGSAGFAIASQNDLPMANKAQIICSAFLAMEMKCARCHDAPNHPYNQADLFAISAMLQRQPVTVPGSSLTKGLSVNSHVTVSLTPGQKIEPQWPFAELKSEPLPGVLRNPEDSRERLATIITDPRNERFSQVIVNRLWKRLLGFGLIDPVDDWEDVSASHPELLAWLGRQLATQNYDLKAVARLILNSAAYQRSVTEISSRTAKPRERFFEAPARRRLSAEQVVDCLFQIAGKQFDCEPLNFDLSARSSVKDFINLGVPRRAWEFVGLSNERDRPALAKPAAQTITDVLLNYGWRDNRAEPKSSREEAPNVLQPAILANGIMGARISRLSDDSAFTQLALRPQPLSELVSQLFVQILSRQPSAAERKTFEENLAEGYGERLIPSAPLTHKPRITKAVMWNNHLHPDATTAIYEIEKIVRAGDPATARLTPAWRERMEDAVWALMLSPEFTYVP